jgi:hypothetical protein
MGKECRREEGITCARRTYLEVPLLVEHGHILHRLVIALRAPRRPDDFVEDLNVI